MIRLNHLKLNRIRLIIPSAFVAVALTACIARQAGAATLYDATNAAGSTQDAVHYLQQVTMGGASEYYTITGFASLGVHTTDPEGLRRARLVINFYTGVDFAPGADPLAHAVLIGQQIYSAYAAIPDALIGINFDQPFLAPRTFAMELSYLNEDGASWSDIMTGRFTLAAPVYGTSPGFVWWDQNRDGAFTDPERTTFGAAEANIRVRVVGVPANPPLALVSAVSRKTHGSVGDFDLNLPLTTSPAIESRMGGASGEHSLVFTFSRSVLSGTAAVTSGAGSVASAPIFSGNTMTVPLTGVTDQQWLEVTLSTVTDSDSQVLPATKVAIGFLRGDISGNGTITSSDIGQLKSATGQVIDQSNFRADLNRNGSITSSDLGMCKAATGAQMPAWPGGSADPIEDQKPDGGR